MGTRGRARIVACIVLAALAGGCGQSGGVSGDRAPGWPSGAVRRGQIGKVADAPAQPPPPPGLSRIEPYPAVFLSNERAEASVHKYLRIPLTPIVVTEHPAHEEVLELQSALPPGVSTPNDGVRVAHEFVFGARSKCEELREVAQRNGVHTRPCLGPHYFKRTGPPEPVRPTRGGYGPC